MILQLIHRRVASSPFMGMLAILMLFITTQTSARPVDRASYSAEELFRGVFFAEGEVAAKIPQMKGLSATERANTDSRRQEIEAFYNAVVAEVKKSYPSYMGELKAAVDSRKHASISQKITEGTQILEAVIDNLGYERDAEAEATLKAGLEKRINEGMSVSEAMAEADAELSDVSGEFGNCILICYILPIGIILWYIWFLPMSSFSVQNQLFQEEVVSALVKL